MGSVADRAVIRSSNELAYESAPRTADLAGIWAWSGRGALDPLARVLEGVHDLGLGRALLHLGRG